MNRTILIVICDFLLVSLLAFSTVDINKVADQTAVRAIAPVNPAETNRIGGRQDLGDVMRLALDDEHKQQTALAAELARTKLTASQQEALLEQRETQLQGVEQQATRLQEAQTNLVRQMNAAQSNVANLQQQLQATTLQSLITKEQRAAQEAEVRKQLEKAEAMRLQLAALQRSNLLVTAEREQLATQLQLTESEKQKAAARLAQAQEDLNAQRQENFEIGGGRQIVKHQFVRAGAGNPREPSADTQRRLRPIRRQPGHNRSSRHSPRILWRRRAEKQTNQKHSGDRRH